MREAAYERLKFYQNIYEIRRLIYKITYKFPKTHISQIDHYLDSLYKLDKEGKWKSCFSFKGNC